MNARKAIPVEINVCDTAHHPLPNAIVTLTVTEGKEAKPVTIKFDPTRNQYRGNISPHDAFRLHVEATGLEPQDRETHAAAAGLKETVILGKKGLPFYYKQQVKVPFDPLDELLGVAVVPHLQPTDEERLNGEAAKLGLRPEKVADEIRANNVRVFRFTKDPGADGRKAVQEKLERSPFVRKTGPVVHLDDRGLVFLTNEFLVRFNQKVARDSIQKLTSELKLEVVRQMPHVQNGFILRVPGAAGYKTLDAGNALVSRGVVDYAEPNLVATAIRHFTPNDPMLTQQPHHALIHSEGAWNVTMGVSSILVGVMDDGCDVTHPDLTNPPGTPWAKIVNAFNFTTYTTTLDDASHGTRSCGIAAAVADNSLGVVGEAPGCQLMPMEWVAGGPMSDWSDAYIWAGGGDPGAPAPFPAPLAKGADVISNSIGVYDFPMSGVMKDTWDYLACYGRNGRGCVVLFSAGNSNIEMALDGYAQWANYEKIIAVAACTISPPDAVEQKVSTSSYGDGVDVCAPAGGPASGTEARTMSTANMHTYATHGQTSCACPQVAGAAALMLSANPDLNWVELRQILRDTATHIDVANTNANGIWRDVNGIASNAPGYLGPHFSRYYGFGRLNVEAAVQAAFDLVGVDPLSQIDTWIRENDGDIGTVPCPPPYSPDVWVRNLAPAADDPAHVTEHHSPIRGQDNWVYVNVRNRGALDSHDVYARVLITRWAGTQYVYPDDFLPTVMPSTIPTVMAPGTYLIAELHLPSVPAGGFVTVNARWPKELIPPSEVTVGGTIYSWADSCLLVELSPHDGPAPSGNHTWDNNNICQRNISIVDAPAGADAATLAFVVGHKLNWADQLDLVIERRNLPARVGLHIDYIDAETTAAIRRFLDTGDHEPGAVGEVDVRLLNPTKAEVRFGEENKPKRLVLAAGTRFMFPSLAAPGARPTYALKYEKTQGKGAFRLPTVRRAHAPILRHPGTYQMVALRVTGLRELKRGDYAINLYQHDLQGALEGGINLVIRKA